MLESDVAEQKGSYIAKVFVQHLHVSVQYLQGEQLIVLGLHPNTEVQTGIPGRRGSTETFYILPSSPMWSKNEVTH